MLIYALNLADIQKFKYYTIFFPTSRRKYISMNMYMKQSLRQRKMEKISYHS